MVSSIRDDGPSSNLVSSCIPSCSLALPCVMAAPFPQDIAIGDELQSVDGQNINASHFDHVAVLIRGYQGTQVRLTLKRDGEKKEVVATRSVQLSTKVNFSLEGLELTQRTSSVVYEQTNACLSGPYRRRRGRQRHEAKVAAVKVS